MTGITSKVHSRADVERSEQIRQELAKSRGLEPRDYSHFVPRPVAQAKKIPTSSNRSGLSAA